MFAEDKFSAAAVFRETSLVPLQHMYNQVARRPADVSEDTDQCRTFLQLSV